MILFNFNVTMQLFYLIVILIIIREAFRSMEYINNRYVLLYLFIISLLLNFIFHGISLSSLFESIISISLLILIYEIRRILKGEGIY